MDGDGDVAGYYTSIALDSSGNPHISYMGGASNNLRYAYYDGTWHTERVDSGVSSGLYTSIALDSSDNPHISYADDTNDTLKYAYHDGSEWHIETVDNTGVMFLLSGQTSIALDSSDNPHISYYDFTNHDLKHAYYNGSWHVETVDSDGDIGELSSIALDSHDNPHISYSGSGDMKYAYYDGGNWHVETVDSTGYVGNHSSIALDSSDNPHISYHDYTNEDLKHAWRVPTSSPVGGMTEFAPTEPEALGATGSSGPSNTALATAAVGGALLLAAGGWYARRRWAR